MTAVLATVWALGNAWGGRSRWLRGRRERRTLRAWLILAGLSAAWAWWEPARSTIALGVEVGLGSAVFGNLAESYQLPYLAAAGVTLGVALYYWGWLVLPGGAAGALVGWSARWLSPAISLPLDPRVRDPHLSAYRCHVLLCVGDACRERGADVLGEAVRSGPKEGSGVRLDNTACLGYCRDAPVIWVEPAGRLIRQAKLRDMLRLFGEPEHASGEGS